MPCKSARLFNGRVALNHSEYPRSSHGPSVCNFNLRSSSPLNIAPALPSVMRCAVSIGTLYIAGNWKISQLGTKPVSTQVPGSAMSTCSWNNARGTFRSENNAALWKS